MPLPSRDHGRTPGAPSAGATPPAAAANPPAPVAQDLASLRERALDVLLDTSLAPIVALVCWRDGPLVHVADSRGHVALSRQGDVHVLAGRDPVARQDPFSDDDDVYPLAAARLASLFDDPRAPDLAVVHTGAHSWLDRGGHPGEHGSLNGVQSRAPLLLSGAGVGARGVVGRVARTIDVAATLAHLAGGSSAGMEGRPLDLVVPAARYVVGLLWDGAHCADLIDLARRGELPSVARLLRRGCALRGGALAEFPSVTLVNHTSVLTGVGPGRHGIVHNAFFDRETGEQAVPNSPAGWHRAMDWLRPGVQTVFERLPATTTSACVNDPVDRGATYSTFGIIRSSGQGTGSLRAALPPAADDPHATAEQVRASADYAWATQVDASGLDQVLGLWREGDPPGLTWWNTTLTDSGHHLGGPRSEPARASLRDSDRRLGVWLDLVEQRGLLDEVTVVLTADHGSQATDPDCTGEWGPLLAEAGVPFRDEGYGFVYLGEDVASTLAGPGDPPVSAR